MESESVLLDSVRSKIEEFTNFVTNSGDASIFTSSETQKFLQDFVLDFQSKANQIVSDHSDIGYHDDEELDVYMDHLRVEHRTTEDKSASLSKEIEDLTKSLVEGRCQLESNIESLHHAMYYVESKGTKRKKEEHVGNFKVKHSGGAQFQILSVKHQIENNELALESLQDLDLKLKWLEAIEKTEESLTGLKVIDFEENIIRLSLRTCIPSVEGLCHLNAGNEGEPHEVSHELLIEVMDGSMELKSVQIFPNDVYIGEIVEAADSFSKLVSVLSVPETRPSLGWLLQKVQDKIVVCTIRHLIVKLASKSRHSFEYVDNEELIIAHMDGGVDVFIKPSQGWPLSTSVLKLVSLRGSDQGAKEIPLSLLCKVEEAANSLDDNIRKSMSDFVDGIEEILLENMRHQLH